ncbi:MAG: prepilin-type N-terminal cleavage/methylation domain-containing protein [Chloroflexota bacterium]
MRRGERGFTLVEIVVAAAISVLVAGGASLAIFQLLKDTERTNDHLSAVRNVENAAYWINHDTQMADNLNWESLTPPAILVLGWTDWGYDEASVYHSVTYSIEDLSGGIGALKRRHEDSLGSSEELMVADYVYYDAADPVNTTQLSYARPVLTLKATTRLGESQETREFRIYCRPDFY